MKHFRTRLAPRWAALGFEWLDGDGMYQWVGPNGGVVSITRSDTGSFRISVNRVGPTGVGHKVQSFSWERSALKYVRKNVIHLTSDTES